MGSLSAKLQSFLKDTIVFSTEISGDKSDIDIKDHQEAMKFSEEQILGLYASAEKMAKVTGTMAVDKTSKDELRTAFAVDYSQGQERNMIISYDNSAVLPDLHIGRVPITPDNIKEVGKIFEEAAAEGEKMKKILLGIEKRPLEEKHKDLDQTLGELIDETSELIEEAHETVQEHLNKHEGTAKPATEQSPPTRSLTEAEIMEVGRTMRWYAANEVSALSRGTRKKQPAKAKSK